MNGTARKNPATSAALLALAEVISTSLGSDSNDSLTDEAQILNHFPEAPFLFFMRPARTLVVPLALDPVGTAWVEMEIVKTLFAAHSAKYFWNGSELLPITLEQALNKLRSLRPHLLHFLPY